MKRSCSAMYYNAPSSPEPHISGASPVCPLLFGPSHFCLQTSAMAFFASCGQGLVPVLVGQSRAALGFGQGRPGFSEMQ